MNIKLTCFINLFLIIIIKCNIKNNQDHIEEELNNDEIENYDEIHSFNLVLKDYLIKNNLFDSERVIEPGELKKIFLDVITEGQGAESTPSYLRKIFVKLSENFVEKYYKDRKQIKGKDIFDLFNAHDIFKKFDQIANETPFYDENDEEKEHSNNKNDSGEVSPDL